MPRRRLLSLALVSALLSGTIDSVEGSSSPSEYDVKAAYLFHFASFVAWPEDALVGTDGHFVVGVLGQDPFDGVLEATLLGKTVAERNFVIRRGSRLEDLGHPHILFISSSEGAQLPHILGRLDAASVLTVGESDDFAALGGIIGFTMRSGRVRFEINVQSASRARLRISSQLLKLATTVKSG